MLANKLWFLFLSFLFSFACEQALRGALAAGQEKEGEFHLQFSCGPSSELSNFRQSARSGNERECKQTLEKRGYNFITKVISANQLCFPGNANLIQYHQSPIKEKVLERPRTAHRPFASSKNSHEATSKTFNFCKNEFQLHGIKKKIIFMST